MTDIPGRQQLTGYRLRDYDDLIARLANSRESQSVSIEDLADRIDVSVAEEAIAMWLSGGLTASGESVFDLAAALGYDLALIPREDHHG